MTIKGMVDRNGYLNPCDGARSFYHKAKVIEFDDGKGLVLVSYCTPVMVWKDDKLYRTWAGWSATTSRHVKSFCQWLNQPAPNKKQWDSMPCEDYYTLVV